MTPRRIIVTEQSRIILNQQCDNNSTEVLFLQDDPALLACTWTLLHQRPRDSEPYLVPLTKQDGGVLWTVSATDCATAGRGRAQLICTSTDGSVMRSRLYTTIIAVSMGAAGDVPATMTPYVDQIAGYAAAAEAAVEFVKEQTFAKSVNGLTPDSAGNVDLSAEDVGARPNTWTPTAADVGAASSELAELVKTYGIGNGTIVDVPDSNFDTLTTPGIFKGRSDLAIGIPSQMGEWVFVLNLPYDSGGLYGVQFALDMNGNTLCQRYKRNGTWSAWGKVYSEGQKPTAADIGARPDTWMPTAADVGAATPEDVSSAALNRNAWVSGNTITNLLAVDLNDPGNPTNRSGFFDENAIGVPSSDVAFGIRYVHFVQAGFVVVEAWCYMTDNRSAVFTNTYNKNAGTWLGWVQQYTTTGYTITADGEFEWHAPQMVVGVERRLAERWAGQPVYAMLVDFGALPNSTYKSVSIGVGASKIISVYGFGYNATDGAFMHFPTVHGGAIGAACFVNASGGLVVETYRDMSAWVGKFIVKYTK